MPIDLLIGHQQEDGSYKDEEGVEYEDAEQYLKTGILGMCMCGSIPEGYLNHILDSLELIQWPHDQSNNNVPFDVYYSLWRSKCNLFFGSPGAEDFMWHWLDREGLTEHGGNVSGGWLTDKGYAMIEAIKKVMSQDV